MSVDLGSALADRVPDELDDQAALLAEQLDARRSVYDWEAATGCFDQGVPTWVTDSSAVTADGSCLVSGPAGAPPHPLAATAAGTQLAELVTLIESFDLSTLGDDAVIDLVAACERAKAALDGRQLAAIADLTRRCTQLRGVGSSPEQVAPEVLAAVELAPALRVTTDTALGKVWLAQGLERLPLTRAALAAGELTLPKARAVVEAAASLGDEEAAAVERRVLVRARRQTPSQLRAALRRAVLAANPDAARRRHERARAERGVWRRALEDGLGQLTYVGGMEQVEAAYQWINALAQEAQQNDRDANSEDATSGAGGTRDASGSRDRGGSGDASEAAGSEVRTLAQCRADVLGDLGIAWMTGNPYGCCCSDASDGSAGNTGRKPRRARRAEVRVVVAASTLLGEDDEPGELIGVGPLSADAIRAIAADATWKRLLVEPGTRRLLDMSSQGHDPPESMRRFVQVRDRTCRSPGCRRPAEQCDLDHTLEWPCGPTCPSNLSALCRTHHRIKTLTDTRIVGDGQGGLTWTMPSGKTYHQPPDPVLDHPGLDRPVPDGPVPEGPGL